MLPRSLAFLTLLLASAPAFAQAAPIGWSITQFSFHRRTVVRVPRVAPSAPTQWRERKGPQCVAANQLAGAIVHPDGADLVLLGGDRVRVKLDGDCPALGYYSGFYLKPAADGMVCTGRDAIRSRAGDACRIRGFKRLVPKR